MTKRLFLVALAVSLCADGATVGFSPGVQSEILESTFTVDVTVSGLAPGQVVGGFDLTVLSNIAIVSATGVDFLGALGAPASQLTGFDINIPGEAKAAEVSFESLATLESLQAAQPFSAFRLSYLAIGLGTTQLAFSRALLSDANGNPITIDGLGSGSIQVTASNSVPELPTAMPIGGGLALLFMRWGRCRGYKTLLS